MIYACILFLLTFLHLILQQNYDWDFLIEFILSLHDCHYVLILGTCDHTTI